MDFKNKFKFSRVSFHGIFEKLQSSTAALVLTVITAVILMACACLAVFFIHVRGPEEVMVPEVRGKELTDALMEMQNKELYPKITLRYSDNPGDEGTILDQNPSAGSIVKGYSRVSLVVSRGVIVDKVDEYTGMNYEDLKLKLQTLFAGSVKPLIVLQTPEYKADVSEAGTILEQNPPEGTEISEPVKVQLVVSKGPNFDNTRVPNLKGQTINDMLQTISRSRLIFDISSHPAEGNEKAGTVVDQEAIDKEFIKNYSRIKVEFALPKTDKDGLVYGIFNTEATDYPYPVPMRLDVTTEEEGTYTLVSFNHIGGNISIPYAVPKEATLTLYIVDKASKKIQVH